MEKKGTGTLNSLEVISAIEGGVCNMAGRVIAMYTGLAVCTFVIRSSNQSTGSTYLIGSIFQTLTLANCV